MPSAFGYQLPILAVTLAKTVFPAATADMKYCAVVTNGKVIDTRLGIKAIGLKVSTVVWLHFLFIKVKVQQKFRPTLFFHDIRKVKIFLEFKRKQIMEQFRICGLFHLSSNFQLQRWDFFLGITSFLYKKTQDYASAPLLQR